MISNTEYQKITKDIAGARTKSRFTFEIAYGVTMVYEEYMKDDDFFIIFDYACDIEKSVGDKISFYQLKTKDKRNFTIDALLSTTTKKPKSILQILIDLKKTNSVDKLYIVSNSHLSGEGEKIQNMECFPLSSLSLETQNKINEKIVWPLGIPDLKNVFYCTTQIILKDADNSLIGITDKFLNSIFPSSYTNPSSFKKSIMAFAREKADYEFETDSLEDTIQKKGVTRNDVNRLLDDYRKGIIQSIIPPAQLINDWINKLSLNVLLSIKVKNAFLSRFGKAYATLDEKELIKKIFNEFSLKYADLSPCDAIKKIVDNFPNNEIVFHIEDKYVFAIIAYENGGI